MNTIPLKEIHVPKARQRLTFDEVALAELRDSILEHGMFHAILLRPDRKTLVAGESRIRSLSNLDGSFVVSYDGIELPPGHVPYSITNTDDPVAIFEIELHENIKRRDLPWQERAAAEAKLHQLRVEQHGAWSPKENPTGWSMRKTAKELNPEANGGQYVKTLSENLDLAEALSDPEISKIKDRKTALKMLQKKRLAQTRASEALTIQIESKDFIHRIGDSIDLVQELPDSSIDILLTDPPYGRDFHEEAMWSGAKREFDDSLANYKGLMQNLFSVLKPKLKPQAHLYIFCDIYHFHWLAEQAMFVLDAEPWRHPLIWDKGAYGSYAKIEFGPRHVYDNVLFANRGKKPAVRVDQDIIRNINPLLDKNHPDQKPTELFRNLLLRSATAGDTILDPFCGSGTVFAAAHDLQIRVFGFERDEQWVPFINMAKAEGLKRELA